jgi:serine/threonine protein kinase
LDGFNVDLSVLLSAIGTAISAGGAVLKMGDYVLQGCRKWSMNQKAEDLRQWLKELGLLSPDAIRNVVKDWKLPRGSLGSTEREEVAAMLIGLSKGARLLTTAGKPRSSYLRCERLLEQLVNGIQPVCHKGDKVGDAWTLEQFLGMGSFGEVWMATNPYMHHKRAYKFFASPAAKRWVLQEQQNLNYISKTLKTQHNIVGFEDVAIDGKERPYVALEYVDGGSLEDWILEDPAHRIKLDKHEVVRGVATGLAAAHNKDICHRDLKPANVVLATGRTVVPKITDFGLGKIIDANRPQVSATRSLAVQVGTSMYLPPEAMEPFIERSPKRDDVFALGVLWYQLLVERLERPPYDFARRLQRASVETHIIRLIERCLAHAEDRFEDAGELLEEMEDASPPLWEVPAGLYDVQYIVREYLGSARR